MAILPANTDYTNRDFDALRARLVAQIRASFPAWSDLGVTNIGTILMESFCFVSDVMNFTQDHQSAEARITTAFQRKNLRALCKLINYEPALATPSTVDVTFTATGLAHNCIIPAGTIVQAPDARTPVEFRLLSPVTLTPGAPSAIGTVENSTIRQLVYTGTGRPDQTVTLPEPDFVAIVGSITGSTSGAWKQADGDNFLLTNPSDQLFIIQFVDNDDRGVIRFSDGISGAIPGDGESFSITYATGGGAKGNVAPHSIAVVVGPLYDVASDLVSVTVDNALGATGGTDKESTASIRVNAPASLKIRRTAISKAHFEADAVSLVPGIARALMLTRNEVDLVPPNMGRLYIVLVGNPPDFASIVKRDQVRRLFVGDTRATPPRPAPMTFQFDSSPDPDGVGVYPAPFLDLTFSAKVSLARGANPSAVRAAISKALADFFDPVSGGVTFGWFLRDLDAANSATVGQLPLSTLMGIIRDAPGVRSLSSVPGDFLIQADVTTPSGTTPGTPAHVDVDVPDEAFPRFLGGLNLMNGDTGGSF
jgi:hypothetical protein